MKFLKSFDEAIARLETFLLVTFVLIMIGLSFSQVIMRNFFSGGFTWADVCLRNMVLWVGFIGASLATGQNRHITIDALTKFLSPFWKRMAELVTSLFSFGLGIVFIVASFHFIESEYEAQGMAFLGIPFWVVELIIPIGFGLISLRFLLKAMEDLASLIAHVRGTSSL